ncbi:hypothetical protein DFH08DRAFT_803785 [Mycena albidolilacea]|uniref:Fumarylacetoacetase-like C-terminal domain-containing protein n=1 Tax=Mycena albidolilacea TaxID=1033008 RepID=A0AAD7EX39_9AGAR|nr:hypothetical protein DFH08DRAFT_803785 [Mycena albidolilacea]
MSISLFKPNGRYKDIKWIPITSEIPTNASLVTAALPDDVIIIVVKEAAQDRPTAVSLALVSKAIGRMAELILYNRVVLRSLATARIFTSTLRTKNRQLLASVTELTLMTPTPRDFEDFWALVDLRCPHIERLSVFVQDLDVVRPTRIQPHNLSHSFGNPPGRVEVPEGGGDPVSHLYLPNHSATLQVPLLQPATGFPRLTHFSCYADAARRWDSPLRVDDALPFLALSTLRVCVIASVKGVYLKPNRRLVILPLEDVASLNEDGQYWECAEKIIAARPLPCCLSGLAGRIEITYLISQVATDVWTFSRPFALYGWINIGGRSTAVKLAGGGVWVIASTPLSPETKAKLDELGPVEYIVGVSAAHSVYLASRPAAAIERRDDKTLTFDGVWGKTPSAPSTDSRTMSSSDKGLPLLWLHQSGCRLLPCGVFYVGWWQVVITLVLKLMVRKIEGDLIFNFPGKEQYSKSKSSGHFPFYGPFGKPVGWIQGKLSASRSQDKAAMKRDVQTVAEWNFVRIIPYHGDVMEKDTKKICQRTMIWVFFLEPECAFGRCEGRNYMEHVKELNNTAPKEPFFFLKPTTSYIPSGGKVEIPKGIVAHHEVELGVVIGKGGRDITQANAESHVAGYALAVDMTARNLQDQVKRRGLPWSAAKGFDTFTPIGSFIPKEQVADPHNLGLSLKINGAFKQNGTTADMIFKIPRLIEHISSIMTLEARPPSFLA